MPVINPYDSVIAAKNPKIWFKFNETSGTPNNSGSLTASLTAYGTPTLNQSSSVDGRSIYLNGTSGYRLSDFSSNSLLDDRSFTIEVWFKSPASGYTSDFSGHFFRLDQPGVAAMGLRLLGTAVGAPVGKVEFFVGLPSGFTSFNIYTDETYNDDKWHHVVATMNTTSAKLYVDAVLKKSATLTLPSSFDWDDASGIKTIGYTTLTTERLKGNIDEFAMYDYELSADQILSNYQSGALVNFTDTPGTATALFVNPTVSVFKNANINAGMMGAVSLMLESVPGNLTIESALDSYLTSLNLQNYIKFETTGLLNSGSSGNTSFFPQTLNNTTYGSGGPSGIPYMNIGSDGFVTVLNGPGGSQPLWSGAITNKDFNMGFWFKTSSSAQIPVLEFKDIDNALSITMALIGVGDYGLELGASFGTSTGTQNTQTYTSYTDGKWHYFAVSYKSSTGEVKHYYDGSNTYTSTITGTLKTPTKLILSGPIDIAALYVDSTSVVTSTIVTNIWNAGKKTLQASAHFADPQIKLGTNYYNKVATYSPMFEYRMDGNGIPYNFGTQLSPIGRTGSESNIISGQLGKNVNAYKFTDKESFYQGRLTGINYANNAATMLVVAKVNPSYMDDGASETYGSRKTLFNVAMPGTGGFIVGASTNKFFGYVSPTDYSYETFLESDNNTMDDQWHLLALVKDGNTAKFYFDGNLAATEAFTGATLTSGTTWVELGGNEVNFFYESPGATEKYIDHAALINSALTAEQIMDLWQLTPIFGAMKANGLFRDPTLIKGTGNIYTTSPMYASALIVDPGQLDTVNQLALPMIGSAEFVMPVYLAEDINDIEYGASAITASALFRDPVIRIDELDVVTPMTASGLMRDPSVSVTTTISININATPVTASGLFRDPAIVGIQGYTAQAMSATARIQKYTTGTAGLWDGWDADLLNYFKNADAWHGYGISNANGATTAPFTFGDDMLQGEITPAAANGTWSTSGWGLPFSTYNGLAIFRNGELTYGPSDDGIYAISGITNLEDAYFTMPTGTGKTVINPITERSVTIPTVTRYKNIGSSSYSAAVNMIKGFSYEFLFKTTQANSILASGAVADSETDNTYWSEFRIENGYPVFEYKVVSSDGLVLNEYKFTGSTLVNNNEWTHLVIQTNNNDGTYQDLFALSADVDKHWIDPITLNNEVYHSIDIYVNGELSARGKMDYAGIQDDTTNASIGNIATIGRRFNSRTASQDGVGASVYYATSSNPELNFIGTWAGMVKRVATVATTQYVGTSSNTLQSSNAHLSSPDIKIMSNLALKHRVTFAETSLTASAEMVAPTISTNTKKLLRLYFFAENANNEMFGVNTNLHNVLTYSVLNNVSTNKDTLFNADKAYLGGSLDPETASSETIVDSWRDPRGYRRFINLQSDVAQYEEIDGIIFMDYPDDSNEITSMINGYSPQWVYDKLDEFLSSIKQAVNDGKGLFVSSSQLAKDLKIVSGVEEVSQNIESSVAPTDPFNDYLGDTFYDTNRNNKYKIIALEDDLTNIPSHIMTDFISHTADVSDDYHVKYENRPNGLKINDQLIIPSLPLMKSQLNVDLAGDRSNRLGENTLEVFAESKILAGRVIAKLADTNYVTTIILEPGDLLDGEIINGKIIVNCVEDGLAMGLDEYNYGNIQVVSVNDYAENDLTIQWQYSTSRTSKKLDELNMSQDTHGQTYPTNNGGGGIIQAPTHAQGSNIRTKFDQANETFTSGIYYTVDGEKYSLDRIPVYSMTYRGINWLLQSSDREGTYVGDKSAVANASMVNPTVTAQIVGSIANKNASYTASTMTASGAIITNISALFGNANTILLTLHHQDVITLYIEKERL
jgi:hypothetical protein